MASLFEFNSFTLLEAADVIAGTLADAKVRLTQAPVPLNNDTTFAELVAANADYGGYAQANIDWMEPSIADDGQVEVVGTVPEFRPANDDTPNDIIGCYISNAANNDAYFVGNLDGQPLPMNDVTDAIILVVRYRPATGSLTVAVS